MSKTITISTTIHAPVDKVWECWTKPEHITNWAFAQDDWEAPAAENDLKVGGRFKTVMASKDGKNKFDFTGTYTEVVPHKVIAYTIDDDRTVKATFEVDGENVNVTETFEMENQNSEELQRNGWQAILNNFKKYVESQNS